MNKFRILDISGDVGIEAYGKTMSEAFVNAAAGMYSLITDLSRVEEARKLAVSVESESIEGLLVSWLNELVFHFDTYGFIGKRADIVEFPLQGTGVRGERPARLKALLYGEDFDPARHEGNLLIKAATYHQLKIEEKEGLWTIDVIFDI